MRCLRTLLRVRWQDKVPDTEVLQRAESESIHAVLQRSQLRWAGHVLRLDDSRLPKRLLYSELSTGRRSLGRPMKRYKDTLKEVLKSCGIPHPYWEATARDRSLWGSHVKAGVTAFEERRTSEKEEKRRKMKDLTNSTAQPGSAPSIPCPHCNRFFCAKIGLISHLLTHPTSQ